jgi:hypothetical protein
MVLAGSFPQNAFSVVAVPKRYAYTNSGVREELPVMSLTELREAIEKGARTENPKSEDVLNLQRKVDFLIVGGCHTYAALVAALEMVRMHVCMFRCVFPSLDAIINCMHKRHGSSWTVLIM